MLIAHLPLSRVQEAWRQSASGRLQGACEGGGQARCWQGQRRGDRRACVRVCARACGRRGRRRSSAVRYAGRCRCAGAAVQVGGRLGIRGASSGSGLLQGLFHVRILGAPRDRTMHASGKAGLTELSHQRPRTRAAPRRVIVALLIVALAPGPSAEHPDAQSHSQHCQRVPSGAAGTVQARRSA